MGSAAVVQFFAEICQENPNSVSTQSVIPETFSALQTAGARIAGFSAGRKRSSAPPGVNEKSRIGEEPRHGFAM